MSSLFAVSFSIVLAVALASCTSMTTPKPDGERLVHVVAFWLKPDAPADAVARMHAFYRTRVVTEVDGVESAWMGKPRPSERSVVDASFSCMSVLRFASASAELAWQTHPVHDAFKAMCEPWLARVVVYDFLEQA